MPVMGSSTAVLGVASTAAAGADNALSDTSTGVSDVVITSSSGSKHHGNYFVKWAALLLSVVAIVWCEY